MPPAPPASYHAAVTADDDALLRRAIEVAWSSRRHGNHPFGAVLGGPHGQLLLEAENTRLTERDCTGHAETNLMRLATRRLELEQLARCTLYASTEPCAMCAGAIYWGNVGRVVFGLPEAALAELVGADPANPVLDLPCREVFARGGRVVEVVGPLLVAEARAVHEGYWLEGYWGSRTGR